MFGFQAASWAPLTGSVALETAVAMDSLGILCKLKVRFY